ncbi:hypothetical protein O0L34_g17010 [Tuta absoluta]|nr:hypothetical protein O0L34_g17010 [Tuta absoluta]
MAKSMTAPKVAQDWVGTVPHFGDQDPFQELIPELLECEAPSSSKALTNFQTKKPKKAEEELGLEEQELEESDIGEVIILGGGGTTTRLQLIVVPLLLALGIWVFVYVVVKFWYDRHADSKYKLLL